jgi:hypothetical protein
LSTGNSTGQSPVAYIEPGVSPADDGKFQVVFVNARDGVFRIVAADEANDVGGTNIGPDAGNTGFGIPAAA